VEQLFLLAAAPRPEGYGVIIMMPKLVPAMQVLSPRKGIWNLITATNLLLTFHQKGILTAEPNMP